MSNQHAPQMPSESREAPTKSAEQPKPLTFCNQCQSYIEAPGYHCSLCGQRRCERCICEDGNGHFYCAECRDRLLGKQEQDTNNEPLDFLQLAETSFSNALRMMRQKETR